MPIIEAVLLTLFSLLLGHLLTKDSGAADRRRQFRSKLDVLLAQLHDTNSGLIFTFHRETSVTIRDECAKIRGDICWVRRRRLDEAAHQYYCLEDNEEASQDKNGRIYFPGRERVQELLRRIRDCAQ